MKSKAEGPRTRGRWEGEPGFEYGIAGDQSGIAVVLDVLTKPIGRRAGVRQSTSCTQQADQRERVPMQSKLSLCKRGEVSPRRIASVGTRPRSALGSNGCPVTNVNEAL